MMERLFCTSFSLPGEQREQGRPGKESRSNLVVQIDRLTAMISQPCVVGVLYNTHRNGRFSFLTEYGRQPGPRAPRPARHAARP